MSQPMKTTDPAFWMKFDGVETVPLFDKKDCYICQDPEFAEMGLPLCYPCYLCGSHVSADDTLCVLGHDQTEQQFEQEKK